MVSTYQAVSGWGKAAMEELEKQVPQWVAGGPVEFDPSVFTRPIALDCSRTLTASPPRATPRKS